MKHRPIALGFAAFSAMSLIVACDVDPNRVDPDVDNTILKKLCVGENSFNPAKVNERRKTIAETPAGSLSALRSFGISKGELEVSDQLAVDENSLATEALTVDMSGCPRDIKVSIPAALSANGTDNDIVSGKVDDIKTHQIDFTDADGNKYVLDSRGIDVNMSQLDQEDIANTLRLTKTAPDGTVTVILSETVEQASDMQVLAPEEYNLLIEGKTLGPNGTSTVSGKITPASAGAASPLAPVKGPVRLQMSEWKDIAEGK